MGGRICGLVNFGTVKISKEKTAGAMCEEFGKVTYMHIYKRVVVSMGGVLGQQYASTRTVGSDLFRSSHAMRFTNRGEGVGRVGVISCGWRLDFT